MAKTRTSLKIAFFSLLLITVAGISWLYINAREDKADLPVLGEPGHIAGPFSFINQDGKQVTDQSELGKVAVVEYFFTTCPNICPKMNSNLKEVYDQYKNENGFVILSHTVNPEKDSSTVLKAYAAKFNAASPQWEFLTGDKNQLYNAAIKDYLLSVADSGDMATAFIHTQYVALLDKKRQIRGFYDAMDKESIHKLEKDISLLLKD